MGPDADARQELTLQPVLVSQLCFILNTYLALNPRLFHLRLWLLPITLYSLWYLCTHFAFSDPTLNSYNFGLCSVGATIAIQVFQLGALSEPPRYDGKLACERKDHGVVCWGCVVNTGSYLMDPRCLHWNSRSGACHTPEDTRRDGSHAEFYIDTLVRFLKHGLYVDFLLAFVMNLTTSGSVKRDTVFRDTFEITNDFTIHVPHPFLGALPLTIAAGFLIMNILALEHYLVTLLAAPATWFSLPASSLKKEWPPLFDHPSRASCLRDFWTNRWQGSTRRYFAFAGGKPGSVVGGYAGQAIGKFVGPLSTHGKWEGKLRSVGSRMGYVLGTFFVSGLIHDFGTWGMGQGMDLRQVTGYFVIQGVGVILESALGLDKGSVDDGKGSHGFQTSALYRCLKKVWVPLWIVLPATMMIEAWIKRGFAFVANDYSPSMALFGVWNEFAFGK
ncbi:hypothetical protein FRC12_000494 [Ceratobasidium sp. 428]|nr:hypothetical protein FRC12_000494 [Ceratobasidium sp. 428]